MTWKYRRHIRFAYSRHLAMTLVIGCILLVMLVILMQMLQVLMLLGGQVLLNVSDQELAGIVYSRPKSPAPVDPVPGALLTLGVLLLSFWLAPLLISRPREDSRHRPKDCTDESLRDGLMEQVKAAPDLTGQLKVMTGLLEEYLRRFLGFAHLHPSALEWMMGGSWWWCVQAASRTLKDYRREAIRTDLPAAVTEKIDAYGVTFSRWDSMRLYHLDLAQLEAEMLAAIHDLRNELAALPDKPVEPPAPLKADATFCGVMDYCAQCHTDWPRPNLSADEWCEMMSLKNSKLDCDHMFWFEKHRPDVSGYVAKSVCGHLAVGWSACHRCYQELAFEGMQSGPLACPACKALNYVRADWREWRIARGEDPALLMTEEAGRRAKMLVWEELSLWQPDGRLPAWLVLTAVPRARALRDGLWEVTLGLWKNVPLRPGERYESDVNGFLTRRHRDPETGEEKVIRISSLPEDQWVVIQKAEVNLRTSKVRVAGAPDLDALKPEDYECYYADVSTRKTWAEFLAGAGPS